MSIQVAPHEPPRGIRNNNPGNIRLTQQNWEGKIPNDANTDGAFEQFTSFAYGIRALVLLLRNYIRSGRNSVRRIIRVYAPAHENDTGSYMAFLVQRLRKGGLEVTADSELPLNRTTLRLLARGIARIENGIECIDDGQFIEGFNLLSAAVKDAIPD